MSSFYAEIFSILAQFDMGRDPKVFGLETNTDASLISTLKLCVGGYSPGLCAVVPPTPPLSIVHCMACVLAKILLQIVTVLPFSYLAHCDNFEPINTLIKH